MILQTHSIETIAQQVANLRLEIAANNWQMIIGVLVLTTLAVIVYVQAVVHQSNHVLHKLVMFLVIVTVFWTARGEYLQHRPAGYIKLVTALAKQKVPAPELEGVGQVPGPDWESYKDGLNSKWWFLLPMSSATGLVLLYLFWESGRAIKKYGGGYRDEPDRRFVRLMDALFWIGFIAALAAPFAARW